MSDLELDRMELDEVGYSSRKLAEEIHRQVGTVNGEIPIVEIALALDIVEIKSAPLTSFEGALLTKPERSFGSILVNSKSGPRRRKFTIAHELLHFLNDRHVQTEEGFRCRKQDFSRHLSAPDTAMSQHHRQEAEANRFAIEVLAPRARFRPYLLRDPDLTAVVELADTLDVSKEATARRYFELMDVLVAMIFHKDRSVRYILKKDGFPRLAIWNNDPLPEINTVVDDRGLTTLDLVNNEDWLEKPMNGELTVQTLVQQDGHGITLLILDRDEDDDEGDVEDAFDRYSRWG